MKDPVWIDAADVYAFHGQLLSMFGGLDGVRDEELLHSALSRPQSLLQYEDPSLFEMAAGYAHGLIKNHPFLDGNKRCGFMAAALFLEVNGVRFGATEESAVAYTRALAAGEIGAKEYAEWLRESCA